MNIESEIKHIQSLVALILSRTSVAIKNRKNKAPNDDEFKNSNGYLLELHKNLEQFNAELIGFNSKSGQTLTGRVLPDELLLMLTMYFKLLESLLYSLLFREGGISIKLTSEVFSIFDKVSDVLGMFFSKKLITSAVSERLIPAIIDLNGLLENELQLFLAKDVRAENDNRITVEMGNVRSFLKNELNEISHQYSEGRAQLMESVVEHEKTINALIERSKEDIARTQDELGILGLAAKEKNTEIDSVVTAAKSCLEIAEGILKKTSQVGMAAAFQKRHDTLKWPVIIWFLAFFGFLVGLTLLGVTLVQDVFPSAAEVVKAAPADTVNIVSETEKSASSVTSVSMTELIVKLAVSFPLIWGAWFSAKQYSHASQLREDYAYKVAVAMTYHGYKDEAADVNKEMSGKLLDSIITQFSDNPVRLYQNNNSASVIEAMLKNDKFSDIINSAKNGVSGSAK